MDIGITAWKAIVAVATLGACAWLLFRNRVAFSKVVFAVGLTAYAVLGLTVNPIEKRIARLERELAILPQGDPERANLERALAEARKNWQNIKDNPSRIAERFSPVTLGLDMLGGTELRLRLEVDPSQYQRLVAEADALRQEQARLPQDAAAADRRALEDRIKEKDAAAKAERESLDSALTGAVDVIRERLNNSGLAEIPVAKQGEDRVLIQLPGVDEEEANVVVDTVRQQGNLQFRVVSGPDDPEAGALVKLVEAQRFPEDVPNLCLVDNELVRAEATEVDEDGFLARAGVPARAVPVYDWLFEPTTYDAMTGRPIPGNSFLVKKHVELGGTYVTQASYEPDVESNGFKINLRFNRDGAMRFERITQTYLQRRLAIVLDGRLRSAPTLQTVIPNGQAQITGGFSQAEAKKLAAVLKSGSMRARIELEYTNKVGATLGEDSIRAGVFALLLGFAGVVLFMWVYYRSAAGLISDVILVVNVVFIFACLSALGATMTLPGLAGLVLTLGMNVDANVLIFERIREEREKGNPLPRAVHLGYSRAFVTIVDANITTLITALILHSFGTEQVRGFAMTLMIGILTGMFCSIVMTRWLIDWGIERKWIAKMPMMKLMSKTSIDFLGKRRIAFTASALAVVLGLGLFFGRGVTNNLGQDLVGGVLAQFNTAKPYSMREARAAADAGAIREKFFDGPDSLQSQGQAVVGEDGVNRYTSFTIRTKYVESNAATLARRRAENDPSYRMHGEDEFRQAIHDSYTLVNDGLAVGRERLDEQAPEGETAYRTDLSLTHPLPPREIGVALVDQPGIMPLWIGPKDAALPKVNGTDITLRADVPLAETDAAARERAVAAVRALAADWLPAGAEPASATFGPARDQVREAVVRFVAARPVDRDELLAALDARPEARRAWPEAKWDVVVSVTGTEALFVRDVLPRDAAGTELTAEAALAAFVADLRALDGTLLEAGAAPLWTRAAPRAPGWRVQAVLPLARHFTQGEIDAAVQAADVDARAYRMALFADPAQADDPISDMTILVSLPIRDQFGQSRSDAVMYKEVREMFQGLPRLEERIGFHDPMPRFTSVGASVAAEMATNSLMAIFYSLIAIFAYIWLRFQFRVAFSLAAVIGLLHDVAIALGALAFVEHFHILNGQIDLTVVAALLTVVGYSLNNTIVVFDRMREHLHDANKPVGEVVNRAVNETLSRTVITAGTTLWVVLMLLVFGGDVIRGFAFTLFVGIGVGTYSSMFLVGPLLAVFSRWAAEYEKRKLLDAQRKVRPTPAPAAGGKKK